MTKIINIGAGRPEPADINYIVDSLRAGRVGAFPTDTVYGLGTSAFSQDGIRRIYDLKAREPRKPLPILVHSVEEARRWVAWPPEAERLARRFWPGALTLVLPPGPEGARLGSLAAPLLGVRVPALPALLDILAAFSGPLAQTSANLSGQPALSMGKDVIEAFMGQVDWIIDGGRAGGFESSVLKLTPDGAELLREGRLKRVEVEEALGKPVS